MNNYFIGSKNQNKTSDWVSGKDFVFSFIGMTGHTLRNCRLDYLAVTECDHTYENGICTGCGEKLSFEGKTISILGDSISTYTGVSNDASVNATLKGGAIYYNAGTQGVYRADTWWQQTIDALNMELLVNNSWSGSAVLHTRSGTAGAYVDRCVQLHNTAGDEPDVIAVFLGTNDFSYYQSALGTADIDYDKLITDNGDGTYTYATPKTTCEAYAVMLHKMVNRYPDAEVYCMNLLPRRKPDHDGKDVVPAPTQFNGELAKVVSHFGCTVVDLENCGITPDPENFDIYITDQRVHPGPLGMDKMTQALIDTMMGKENATFTVSQNLVNVTADTSGGIVLAGGSFKVALTPAAGFDELTVTVTMGGQDLTASVYADGLINIPAVTGDVVITASAGVDDTPDQYSWEINGNSFVNVVSEEKNLIPNALTKKTGSITDGVMKSVYFQLEKPIVLRHNLPWIVEWRVGGANWTGMLLSGNANSSAAGNSYLFKTTLNTGFIGFGEPVSGKYHNYGIALASQGMEVAAEHTYRVENRIAADGSNMAYLLVDGKDYGPMNHYYIGGDSNQDKQVDWLNGRDFCFCYIGSNGHALNNCKLEYLTVWEGGHAHAFENGTCTGCGASHPNLANYKGKVISIMGDSISTFTGYIPTADGFNLEHLARYPQDNLLTDVNETWWMQVIAELDAKLGINDSWRGATLSGAAPVTTGTTGENAAMSNLVRIRNLGAKGTPDVILLYGGTNDLAHVSKVGSFDESNAPAAVDLTTAKWDNLADGFVHTILRMRHFYPDTEIVALLPAPTTSYYSNAKLEEGNAMMIRICEHYGIPYVDLRECGITTSDLPDGIHPDEAGMDYISAAVMDVLLARCDLEAGENKVYSVRHQLTNVTADKHYYKGISDGAAFEETLTGDRLEVTVTMGGTDITAEVYKDGKIAIPGVTGDLVITAKSRFSLGQRLQPLPENICGRTNLWPLLKHDAEYYTGGKWAPHASGVVRSVTIPVAPGQQLWATSFGRAGENGGSINGIRLTWFGEAGVLESVGADAVYAEFAAKGYVEVPEGANAANVVMWTDEGNELYVLDLSHTYEAVITAPTCTERGYTTYTCKCGDRYVDDYVAALGHTPGAAATCTTNQICTVCKVELAPTKGHTEVIDKAVDPTCTETGLTEGKHCSVCKVVLVTQDIVPVKAHDMGDWSVTLAPDCLNSGEESRICRNCGASETQVVPAGGHSFESAVILPTCTAKGYTAHICGTCGYEKHDTFVKALGHKEAVLAAVAPTCTETGLTEGKVCLTCDAVLVLQMVLVPTGHRYAGGLVTKEPTCTADGVKTFACEKCAVSYTETIGATGHKAGAASVENEKQPNCTMPGGYELAVYCTVCNEELSRRVAEVPAAGHRAYPVPAVAPTCTETGLTEGKHCLACKAVLVAQNVVDALGHTEVIDQAVAPTCTATGLTEGKHCSVCNEDLVAQNVVDALGHTEVVDAAVAPTCTATGLTEGKHCSACNEVLVTQEVVPSLGHTEVVDAAVAPTCTVTGLTEGKHCSACNTVLVTQEVVPALGHSFTEQDGKIHCGNCGEELSIRIAQERVLLNTGDALELDVSPAEFADKIEWSIEGDEGVITTDRNVVTAVAAGSVHVKATISADEFECTVRFRVDVIGEQGIEGVQLATTKATAELYKTEYTTLDILLKLPQNYSAQANADQKPVNNGVAIESAKFTDETMAKYFDLVVLDDRTVQIIPTEEALANAKAVKSSYKGTVTVTVDGEPYETEVLTLSVKKTLPKLKATVAAFNSFYVGQTQPIVITGATVTGISLDSSKKQPEWLTLKDGCLVLNEKAPAKSTSGKVYLLVETAEWSVPAALTLSVKNTYKVPGVKLAATSVTVSNQPGPAEVELKLVPTNKADTISGIGITGIAAPEGYTVENFNKETGTFTLKAAEGFKNGKIDLKVNFGNVTNTLKLTVKTQAVKLKLSASKVSLNKDLGDVATVTVNCLTAGFDVTAPVLTYDAEMLDVQYADGKLTVSAKAAVYGKTYPVTVSAYQGAPAVKLNVAILKQNVAVKSTIKATGFIDVIRDGSAITVTPSYTNVLNVDVDKAAVLKIYSSADKFKNAIAEVRAEDGIFTINKSVISDQTLKYKAQLETVIGGNTIKSNLISLTVKMGTAKLTVKSEDTTLFSKDSNDRAMFWFESADEALNGIAKVAFKNAKQANMFDLIDYGDGTYAIGFKDGKVDKSLIGKTVTVTLNVFIEGNQTAKANATANVKLTIVK